jgi:hypothetical protein
MAIQITSAPVDVPTGIRVTAGLIDFNSTTYSAGGLAVTAVQFGAGSNGIPNRLPDFVLFTAASAADDADSDAAVVLRYIKSTAKVAAYGTEPLVDEAGLGEDDAASNLATAQFIAIWVTPTAAGSTLA